MPVRVISWFFRRFPDPHTRTATPKSTSAQGSQKRSAGRGWRRSAGGAGFSSASSTTSTHTTKVSSGRRRWIHWVRGPVSRAGGADRVVPAGARLLIYVYGGVLLSPGGAAA